MITVTTDDVAVFQTISWTGKILKFYVCSGNIRNGLWMPLQIWWDTEAR